MCIRDRSGEAKNPKRNLSYYTCTVRGRTPELCPEWRNNRREALEDALLERLGQYSDPEAVMDLLERQGQETDVRDEAELARVTARLAELEKGFLNDLERLDRGILSEPEYLKRRDVRREEQMELQPRRTALEASVATQKDIASQAASVPVRVRAFLEDFRNMEVPQAKVILQSIVKSAHVYNDGRVELEFRS